MTLFSADLSKIVPGGPKPRNTLSGAPFSTGSAANRKPAPNPKGRNQHALVVEIHKGNNVGSTSNTSERDETLPTPPSAKRRKLDHPASPASSSQTDPLDHISPHAMSFHPSQGTSQPSSQAPSASANSQGPRLLTKRNCSSEFRKVEDMMDSKRKSKKQRHMDNRNYPADNILLPSSPRCSSMSNPIDISGDESQTTKTNPKEAPRSAYRGTARQPPPPVNSTRSNTLKSLKERAGPTQSPYFDKSRLPRPRANGNVKQKLLIEDVTRESSPGLAQKFVAADGSRRGLDVNASSDADELQSAPMTVGQNADTDADLTVEVMRSNSPSKHLSSTLKAATPTDDLAVEAPSTIKSDFPGPNARSRNGGRPTRPAPSEQEAKPPWSVALAAISLPGELLKDDDLGLVYDKKQDGYYVQRRGDPIKTDHSSLQIQPGKLIKIVWEESGLRLRLESSRSGTEDNVLDLEFVRESDVLKLLRRLQESNRFSVTNKNRYVVRTLERAVIHRI